jgi:hypothetical protein
LFQLAQARICQSLAGQWSGRNAQPITFEITFESSKRMFWSRVARWFVFKPNLPIWVNFRGPYVDSKMLIYFMDVCNILWTFWKFYGLLGNFMDIWEIFWTFGKFYYLVHFCVDLVHFCTYQEESGNPVLKRIPVSERRNRQL